MLHHSFLVALPFPVLDGSSFVMLLLALGESDFKLGTSLFPIQGNGYNGITLSLNCTNQMTNLPPMQ